MVQADAAQPREPGARQTPKLSEPSATPEAQPQRLEAAWDAVQQLDPLLKPKSRAPLEPRWSPSARREEPLRDVAQLELQLALKPRALPEAALAEPPEAPQQALPQPRVATLAAPAQALPLLSSA
jgi:hypothetical protein